MKLKINTGIVKIFCGYLAFTIVLSLCARQINKHIECPIKETHAHQYTDLSGLKRYINSENFIYKLMVKSDNTILINEDDIKLLSFIDNNNLYSIDENISKINERIANQHSYIEYEYKKENEQLGWTTNESQEGLTGNARNCDCVYNAYKITKNSNNEYCLEKRDNILNLLEIKDEYQYIKVDYSSVIKGDIYTIDLKNKKVLEKKVSYE